MVANFDDARSETDVGYFQFYRYILQLQLLWDNLRGDFESYSGSCPEAELRLHNFHRYGNDISVISYVILESPADAIFIFHIPLPFLRNCNTKSNNNRNDKRPFHRKRISYSTVVALLWT